MFVITLAPRRAPQRDGGRPAARRATRPRRFAPSWVGGSRTKALGWGRKTMRNESESSRATRGMVYRTAFDKRVNESGFGRGGLSCLSYLLKEYHRPDPPRKGARLIEALREGLPKWQPLNRRRSSRWRGTPAKFGLRSRARHKGAMALREPLSRGACSGQPCPTIRASAILTIL